MQSYLNQMQQIVEGPAYQGDCSSSGAVREYATFLGMAVQSFDASLQYSGGGSTITLRLYDDWCECSDGSCYTVNTRETALKGEDWRTKAMSGMWFPNVFRGIDRYVKDPDTGKQLYHDPAGVNPVILPKLFTGYAGLTMVPFGAIISCFKN